MNIEWNEDKSKATIAADDLKTLQENFNKGFGKGAEKGREEGKAELLKVLGPLKLDPEKLEDSIKAHLKEFGDLKSGNIPADKLQDNEIVKNLSSQVEHLKTQLQEKNTAFEALEGKHESFRRETLIDGKLKELAAQSDTRAINPVQAAAIFKLDYTVDLDDKNQCVLLRLSKRTVMPHHAAE